MILRYLHFKNIIKICLKNQKQEPIPYRNQPADWSVNHLNWLVSMWEEPSPRVIFIQTILHTVNYIIIPADIQYIHLHIIYTNAWYIHIHKLKSKRSGVFTLQLTQEEINRSVKYEVLLILFFSFFFLIFTYSLYVFKKWFIMLSLTLLLFSSTKSMGKAFFMLFQVNAAW